MRAAISARGMTVLEVIIVLALIVGLTAIAAPNMSKGFGSGEYKASARFVSAALRGARNAAVSTRSEKVVRFNIKTRSIQFGPETHVLREDVSLKLDTTAKESDSEGNGAIRFYPDGGSSGGRVTLSRKAHSYLIDVDWLSGRSALTERQE